MGCEIGESGMWRRRDKGEGWDVREERVGCEGGESGMWRKEGEGVGCEGGEV